jgi:hypothetical protein
MAYGSPEGVAALASTWTDNGEFTDPDLYDPGTNPTLARVEEWLGQVSVFANIALAGEGFTVPISHVEVLKAIDLKVNSLVADIVHLQHNKGRLFSDRIRETGDPALEIIERELASWVRKRANGFENLGIPRIVDLESNQAYSVPMARQK